MLRTTSNDPELEVLLIEEELIESYQKINELTEERDRMLARKTKLRELIALANELGFKFVK